jgi:hypothetical protein
LKISTPAVAYLARGRTNPVLVSEKAFYPLPPAAASRACHRRSYEA